MPAAEAADAFVPCPAGWARSDYVVTGDDCAVPVWLRTTALVFCVLPPSVIVGSCSYFSYRMAVKGRSGQPAYRSNQAAFVGVGGVVIAHLLALCSDGIGSSVWWSVLWAAAMGGGSRVTITEVTQLLSTSIGAAFAMQPALTARYIWGAEILLDALSWIVNWGLLYTATVLATNKHNSAPAEHAVLVLAITWAVAHIAIASLMAYMQRLIQRAAGSKVSEYARSGRLSNLCMIQGIW